MISKFGPLYFTGGQVGNYQVRPGSEISDTIRAALLVSLTDPTGQATFVFNDVPVTVEPDSDPELIQRDWSRAMNGYIEKVGPHPAEQLSSQELASDRLIEAENEKRRQKQREEQAVQFRAHRKAVEARLAGAPAMDVTNAQTFDAVLAGDPLTKGIATYARRWARLMQLEMSEGKRLEDVADATLREADLEGMSGYSYSLAVQLLAACWKFGDQLRRWHNLEVQPGKRGEQANEAGGVLSSALLVIDDSQ